jgi:FkbM family methyltransferase
MENLGRLKMRTFQEEFAEIKAEIKNSQATKALISASQSHENRPLVLVLQGTGQLAGAFLDLYRRNGIEVTCVCGNRGTNNYKGIETIDLESLKNRFSEAVVVVCSPFYRNEICEILRQLGFPTERIVRSVDYPWFFRTLRQFELHLDGYEWAYDFFEDECSKRLVLDRLRLILCDRTLVPNTRSGCYYEENFITLGTNEVFVDGGAYDGDSAEEFIDRFKKEGGKDSHVHAFEPDPVNYGQAVRRLSKYPNVTVTQKGLWSAETELVFAQNTNDRSASSFLAGTDSGKYRVPVTSLDGYFKNTPETEWPTFIKMDIEGAEKEALLGAAEIIKRMKPKLAICAYHKLEDIYELPRTILGLRSDYRFILRQHIPGCFDTVLYAV